MNTMGGRTTIGIIAQSVSMGSIQIMSPSASVATVAVFTAYMIAGPATMRTAWTSFVERLTRSPVRQASKNCGGSLRRCAKRALRISVSIRRLSPLRSFRIQNLVAPATTEIAVSTRA